MANSENPIWAKLFETVRGQMLATIEYDEDNETFGVAFRMDVSPGGASVCVTLGGWHDVAKAQDALGLLDPAQAEKTAEELTSISGQFIPRESASA